MWNRKESYNVFHEFKGTMESGEMQTETVLEIEFYVQNMFISYFCCMIANIMSHRMDKEPQRNWNIVLSFWHSWCL